MPIKGMPRLAVCRRPHNLVQQAQEQALVVFLALEDRAPVDKVAMDRAATDKATMAPVEMAMDRAEISLAVVISLVVVVSLAAVDKDREAAATGLALVATVRAAVAIKARDHAAAVAKEARAVEDKVVAVAVDSAAAAEEVLVDAKLFTLASRTSHPASQRSGVTLLELLLALGLTTIVMALIAMSINLNFKMYDTRRTSIEESRLARSVLRHMADDIRAAVQHMPPDLSGLETVLGNSQNASSALGGAGLGALAGQNGQGGQNGQNGAGGGNQNNGSTPGQQQQPGGGQNGTGGGNQNGAGGGNQNGTGGNQMTNTMSGNTGNVNPQTQEAESTYGEQQKGGVIGVYGTSTELQIDISRLPRVDQFQAEVDPTQLTGVVDIPSDMKTVSYFLRPEEGQTDVGPEGRGRGLMRRVIDRAVSNYEMQNGSTGTPGDAELMAEEVVGLQFMYFDGASWTSEWDSASMEGLPVAIEITVILQSLEEQRAKDASNQLASATTEESNERLYTLTVNLPTATSYDEKQQAAAAKEEETALSQTGSIDTSGDAAAAGALGGGLGAGGFPGGMGGGGQGNNGGQNGGGGRGGQNGGTGGNGPGGNGPGGNFPGGFGGNGGGQGPGGQGPGQGAGGQGPRGGGGQGGQGPRGGNSGSGGGRGSSGGMGGRGGGGGGRGR